MENFSRAKGLAGGPGPAGPRSRGAIGAAVVRSLPPPSSGAGRRAGIAKWQVIALVALALVGAWRVRLALMPAEDAIERRIVSIMNALEDRQPKRLSNALVDDFEDEDTGYRRRDVADAARSVLAPGSRYRATLDPEAGIEFLTGPEEVDGTMAATVRVRCTIEVRYGKDQPYGPFWDLEFTADMERRAGTWMFLRTRDVNHGDRPGR